MSYTAAGLMSYTAAGLMSNTSTGLVESEKKVISYEELASLALDSAIACENLIQQQPADLSAVERLYEALRSAPGLGVDTTGVQHISATTVAVYARAVRNTTNEKIRSLSEIVERIRLITHNFDQSKPPQQPGNLRDFCLALHGELLLETYGMVSGSGNWEERERGLSVKLR